MKLKPQPPPLPSWGVEDAGSGIRGGGRPPRGRPAGASPAQRLRPAVYPDPPIIMMRITVGLIGNDVQNAIYSVDYAMNHILNAIF